jgi:hypothetical protein
MAETKPRTQTQATSQPADANTAAGSKRGKPSLPILDETRGWEGMKIDGLGGKTLGRIAGIHVEADGGEPRWALIRLGPLAGCTAIPAEQIAEGAGRLWAAYDRDRVREAPRFRPNESLTALQELELCAHWGIREGQGRMAEVAEQDADEITAVPAQG